MDDAVREQPPRRMTSQQSQETVSRAQFKEALQDWVCNSHDEDYGEDFTVSIYDDGRSTGLTFLAQLKSTTDWKSLIPKRKPKELHYSLEVKDLVHWEDTVPPVVIVVWDVTARCGFWQDVPSILKDLQKHTSGWRRKESATVIVPLENTLDTNGCSTLRHRIGESIYSRHC